MKPQRVKIIYWAFLLSIVVHFTLAPIVRNIHVVEAEKEQTPEVTTVVHEPRPTQPPTPKPTPQPSMTPKPAAAKPVPQPNVPTLTNRNTDHRGTGTVAKPGKPGGGGDVADPGDGGPGTTTPAPTPVPTPTQTPKPTCAAPFVEASTRDKYVPETPELAQQQGLTGQVQVQVDLSASGLVTAARVFDSSGSTVLDNAAVDAAKRTTYFPKTVDCEHVPGSYLFRVNFEN